MKFLTIENKIVSFINQHNNKNGLINKTGDDCAVVNNISYNKNYYTVVTTEQVVSGIHYLYDKTSPVLVGQKLVKRCISNMCAIGGAIPMYASVAITIHPRLNKKWIERLYYGITKECNKWNISICCGDTVLNNCKDSNKQVVISMTLIGKIQYKKICSQSNARIGELIYATGCYGNSFFSNHHLDFIPRFYESIFLSKYITKTMSDVSDGLLINLYNIATKSHVTMCIDLDQIPKQQECTNIDNALMDGEDYELIFTVPVDKEKILIRNWPFNTKLSKIGYIDKLHDYYVLNLKNNQELINSHIIKKFYNKRHIS